ncbi:hypothetical protein SAMN05421820_107184 [Pedobacter steynii]|uniref:Uncharacterized protein n=1 Tax=Pedobacter steynii TaxID=430522 RepID=A0A1H0ARX7_9SPHI|nr:hypothetical protein [Pedobacter steynii]NQX41277.1 hypothetical protein [Pedobacter steynii]SDN36302.1 hypothetical protein SAMN05421820_107184 [Pedobacter steynii]
MDKKNVKKKAEILVLKYNPNWTNAYLDINLGEVFRLWKGKMMVDETPYQDESLVPIEGIEIKDQRYFIFNSFYKKKDTHFIVDFSKYPGGIYVAELLREINQSNVQIDKAQDFLEIEFEENNLRLSIQNEVKGKLIVIGYNQYRSYLTLRFPEPAREYQLGECFIKNNIIYIRCVGSNLWDETDSTEGFDYEWALNLPPNILDVASKLIEIGLRDR